MSQDGAGVDGEAGLSSGWFPLGGRENERVHVVSGDVFSPHPLMMDLLISWITGLLWVSHVWLMGTFVCVDQLPVMESRVVLHVLGEIFRSKNE